MSTEHLPASTAGQPAVALTGADASQTREQAVSARADLARARADLERRQAAAREDLERQRRSLEAEFEAKKAELEAQMGPLELQLKQLAEVVWTVDLYLGRDETLRLLRDGTPVPADIPITVRQRVLVMAEESLVLMGRRESGMDADDVPQFVNWLMEDDANLDRVLPEPKGVVVLVPTKVRSRSGNVFEDAHRDDANQRAYWLIRNGQRLYMLTTDPDLKVRDRVLPKRTEFTEVFEKRLFGNRGMSLGPVQPGSEEWLRMEQRANALQRHYMRILLVLQGLIDRTPAWHPLPEGGVSFLRLEHQDSGKIVLVQDGDDAQLLTDGREDFRQWQLRLNKQLRPGMRVIGDWNTRDFSDEYIEGDRWSRGHHPRIHPGNAAYPPPRVPHLIEGRRDGGLVIRYERTDEVWRVVEEPVPGKPGYVYRSEQLTTPERRASCLIMSNDTWVLPYDLVSVADLEYYLSSRENRSTHFLSLVPTIRAALDAKRAEAQEEAPFRQLLEAQLLAQDAEPDEVAGLVEDLVHWWKVANTWARPLNGDPLHEAKAAREIAAEYTHRKGHETDPMRDAAVSAGMAVARALAVTRNRKGQWHVYSASAPAHDSGVFVDVTPIRKDGTLGSPKREQTPSLRSITALHVAWASEDWATWTFGANRRHYLTQGERDDVVEQMRELAPGPALCVTERHDPTNPGERHLTAYWWAAQESPEDLAAMDNDDPYSWRASGDESLIAAASRSVVKDNEGVHLVSTDRRSPRAFSSYTATTPWGSVPWWPDDAYQYANETRHRLAWADTHELDRVAAYRDRCKAADAAARDEKRAQEAEAYRYSTPMQATIHEQQVTAARERFLDDYGHDAQDLWAAHLASLDLRDPIHPRDLWSLVASALAGGHPVAGQTLEQLKAHAGEAGRRIDLKEYGHLVVPDPDAEPRA